METCTTSQIEGVKIINLKIIADERGSVMHMLRSTDAHFSEFGEIYFSTINENCIKGWKIHQDQTLNLACVSGEVLVALYDNRKDSSTQGKLMEIKFGEDNYKLIIIPKGITHGFKGLAKKSIIANAPDISHDKLNPGETIRIDPLDNSIPYSWKFD